MDLNHARLPIPPPGLVSNGGKLPGDRVSRQAPNGWTADFLPRTSMNRRVRRGLTENGSRLARECLGVYQAGAYFHECESQEIGTWPLSRLSCRRVGGFQTHPPDFIHRARCDQYTPLGAPEVLPQRWILLEFVEVAQDRDFEAVVQPNIFCKPSTALPAALAAPGSLLFRMVSNATASPISRAFSAIMKCSAVGSSVSPTLNRAANHGLKHAELGTPLWLG
jgi:hypothetical protein